MSWTIHLLEDTLRFPKRAIPDLLEALDASHDDVVCYFDRGRLIYPLDFAEHRDHLGIPAVRHVLQRHKASGSVAWADLEGGVKPQFWRHSFDGRGGYSMATGRVVFA